MENDFQKVWGKNFFIRKIYTTVCLPDETIEKGAVGLATPSLTGASRELAVSHNSSIDRFINPWNTRLHLNNSIFIVK